MLSCFFAFLLKNRKIILKKNSLSLSGQGPQRLAPPRARPHHHRRRRRRPGRDRRGDDRDGPDAGLRGRGRGQRRRKRQPQRRREATGQEKGEEEEEQGRRRGASPGAGRPPARGDARDRRLRHHPLAGGGCQPPGRLGQVAAQARACQGVPVGTVFSLSSTFSLSLSLSSTFSLSLSSFFRGREKNPTLKNPSPPPPLSLSLSLSLSLFPLSSLFDHRSNRTCSRSGAR